MACGPFSSVINFKWVDDPSYVSLKNCIYDVLYGYQLSILEERGCGFLYYPQYDQVYHKAIGVFLGLVTFVPISSTYMVKCKLWTCFYENEQKFFFTEPYVKLQL